MVLRAVVLLVRDGVLLRAVVFLLVVDLLVVVRLLAIGIGGVRNRIN